MQNLIIMFEARAAHVAGCSRQQLIKNHYYKTLNQFLVSFTIKFDKSSINRITDQKVKIGSRRSLEHHQTRTVRKCSMNNKNMLFTSIIYGYRSNFYSNAKTVKHRFDTLFNELNSTIPSSLHCNLLCRSFQAK